MKTHSLLWLSTLALALSGCSQLDYSSQSAIDNYRDRDNVYTKLWLNHFGPIASDQDWCLLRAVDAEISTASLGEGVATYIYNDSPSNGGHLIAVATADGSMRFDLRKGVDQVYAEVTDPSGNRLAGGMYAVDGNRVRIDGSSNDGDMPASRYAHDTSNGRSWFDAMIVCEDLGYAEDSDFDFNDIVFGLQHVAGTKTLTVTAMAAGGSIPANISITIGDETYEIGESHALIKPGSNTSTMLNTNNPFVKAGTSVKVKLPSESWTISEAWADKKISIRVGDKGEAYELTPESEGAAPKMICLGGDWYWPVEFKAIDEAYLKFGDWAKGNLALTKWVDNYNSENDVVVWQYQHVANNWFSGTTATNADYQAKINNSAFVTVPSSERQYLYPAINTVNMFNGREDLTSVDITGNHFDASGVTSTSGMFNGCTNLTKVDLSNWDTSNLRYMGELYSGMFDNCENLTEVTFDGWDITHLSKSDLGYIFRGCNINQ